MSKAPQKFRQRDVSRVIRGATAAGREVERVEIEQDGRIVIWLKGPSDPTKWQGLGWDDV